jgi:hypothetical protein
MPLPPPSSRRRRCRRAAAATAFVVIIGIIVAATALSRCHRWMPPLRYLRRHCCAARHRHSTATLPVAAALPPSPLRRCHAATATAALLPSPSPLPFRCRRAATAATAVAFVPTATLPSLRHCHHFRRAAAAVAVLLPPPPLCCHLHCASTAAALPLPPSLPSFLSLLSFPPAKMTSVSSPLSFLLIVAEVAATAAAFIANGPSCQSHLAGCCVVTCMPTLATGPTSRGAF